MVIVVLVSTAGKLTVRVSFDLFHFNPSIVVWVKSPPSCCLAYVSSSFPTVTSPFNSSSLALEFHLCNLKVASSNTSTTFSFRSAASAIVCPPESKSSTYRLLRSSATMSGYLSSHELRCCSITPARRNGEDANPNNTLVNLNVSNCDSSSRTPMES